MPRLADRVNNNFTVSVDLHLPTPSSVALSVRNTGALRQLVVNLRQAPRIIQQAAAAEIKREIEKQIADEFATSTDPYGKAWKPPKDGGKTMDRTGKLKSGFRVNVVSNGLGFSVQITNSQDYAKWLQSGTTKMDARKMVPDAVMPESYRKIFADAYRNTIETWYASVAP